MALWFVPLNEQHDAACFGSKSLSLVGMSESSTSKVGNRSVPLARIIYCIVTEMIKPL